MARYVVTAVTKEVSSDGTHRHIKSVWSAGSEYSRADAATSIKAGNSWVTSQDGYSAPIEVVSYCPKAGCYANPYLRTKANGVLTDNLEKLPEK